jgi:hypothetical protein
MQAIVLKTKEFDREFEATLAALKLALLEDTVRYPAFKDAALSGFAHDLHRKFHYEVVCLKDRLMKLE